MPHDTAFRRLRECVRDEIASTLHEGGGRAREIARSVCARHRDLIGVLGERLAEDAITRLVNREIKRWSAVGTSMRAEGVRWKLIAHRYRIDRSTAWRHWSYALIKIAGQLNGARATKTLQQKRLRQRHKDLA